MDPTGTTTIMPAMPVNEVVVAEDKKRMPPTEIQCANCTHWKHPRASKCKEEGCQCDCVNYQRGIKKKRQRAAIEAATLKELSSHPTVGVMEVEIGRLTRDGA